MNYIGEHTFWALAGRFFTYLAFTGALGTFVFYALNWLRPGACSGPDELGRPRAPHLPFVRAGRVAFGLHSLGILGVLGTLMTAILSHWFEFDYVWRHSSRDLPIEYVFSALWEGQEGSFIIWMFWHVVLGWFLVRGARSWEHGTMAVVGLVQLVLTSMILGVFVWGTKIGSSPFTLIRELPENLGLPWTTIKDYLIRIPAFRDGQGLNPLLQNYWMVIHPPTLFLGFAATLIPFAYTVAAWIERRPLDWVTPALPWVFFGVGVLGTGILMGGAWAYEALSFGGFWAWDPVENASLVPWITLVAAGHLMFIVKKKKTSGGLTAIMTVLTFILVLYSTFLTRSGVLGDSSVHSFVDLGLNGQLLLLLGLFAVGSLAVLVLRWRVLPKNSADEAFSSREFWLVIGSLVLMLSAVQISFSTSIPVLNKIIGPDGLIPLLGEAMAPPTDVFRHYHSVQIPVAIVVSLFMAAVPFLRWDSTPAAMARRALPSLVASLVLGGLAAWGLKFDQPMYTILLITGLFAALANLDYWLRFLRGNWRSSGLALAHLGFALILLGALISNGKKQAISQNPVFLHKDFPANEHLLVPRGDTVSMHPYWVEWTGERREGHFQLYDLNFYGTNPDQTPGEKLFSLAPYIQLNPRMGNVREPSTKHYWDRDIYTYVSFADMRSPEEKASGWTEELDATLGRGDEVFVFDEFMVRCDSILVNNAQMVQETGDLAALDMAARLTLKHMDGRSETVDVPYEVRGNQASPGEAEFANLGVKARFDGVSDEPGRFTMKFWRKAPEEEEFILIQAFIFPYINLLWLGVVMLAVGSGMAVAKRLAGPKPAAKA
ncbi:MAG: cytochrome c biogenesis protein CcsA [Schleiferiaceae bacterium]